MLKNIKISCFVTVLSIIGQFFCFFFKASVRVNTDYQYLLNTAHTCIYSITYSSDYLKWTSVKMLETNILL